MEAIDTLSTIVLLAATVMISLRLFVIARKVLLGSDITVTNKRTKKSVTLGKHPDEGQVSRLIEVLG